MLALLLLLYANFYHVWPKAGAPREWLMTSNKMKVMGSSCIGHVEFKHAS